MMEDLAALGKRLSGDGSGQQTRNKSDGPPCLSRAAQRVLYSFQPQALGVRLPDKFYLTCLASTFLSMW